MEQTVSCSAVEARISRRSALVGALGAGGAALLASGCQVHTSDDSSAPTGSDQLVFPDPVGPLPTEAVTVRILSGGPGPKTGFFAALVKAYHAKHANITLQYDELPNAKLAETIPLQLRNGSAPDMFLLNSVPTAELVAAGQLADLSTVIPEWDTVSKDYPFGALVSGTELFDGKPYSLPFSDSLRGDMLLYNKDYFDKAGIDTSTLPFTFDEFRAAARTITKQGAGEYYGLITPSTVDAPLGELAQYGGGAGASINWKTGQYDYASDAMLAVVELFLALRDDKSLVPGYASMQDQQARARMAQGAAGMILNGPWNFPVWRDQNPDFSYGVARLPGPDKAAKCYASYQVGGANPFAVYAKASDGAKQVIGDIMHWMSTDEGQVEWGKITGAGTAPLFPAARKELLSASTFGAADKAALTIFNDTLRLAPSPQVRNADNDQVALALKKVTPGLTDIMSGLMTGQLSNPKKELLDLNGRSEAALDAAITQARKKGAKVSRDDWKFPNWDPSANYSESDYQSL